MDRSGPSPLVTITLPRPSKVLSPNTTSHWAKKAKAKKNQRNTAYVEALRSRPRGWAPLEACYVRTTFYVPDRRRRDRDNLLASMKSAYDGLADGGIVRDDSGMVHLPIVIEVDPQRPRVVVEILPYDGPKLK